MTETNLREDDSTLGDTTRLQELRATRLMDSEPEESFDRITRIAQRLLGVESAMISLVADDREFFKSQVGLTGERARNRGAGLSHSMCKYAVASGDRFVIEDARRSPLVRQSPAVEEHGVVAYAGHPLRTSRGHILGALCVNESHPRHWTAEDLHTLEELTALTVTEIEYRLRVREIDEVTMLSRRLTEPIDRLADAVRSTASLAEAQGSSDPRLPRMAAVARLRLGAVEALVDDLRSASRDVHRQVRPPRRRVDVRARLERAVRMAGASARAEDLQVELGGSTAHISVDAPEFDKAMTLVVVTALNHLGEGEHVRVVLDVHDHGATIAVTSPGHRMPISDLLRVTSRFPSVGDTAPAEATVSARSRVTTVRSGALTAITGFAGTTFTLQLPTTDAP